MASDSTGTPFHGEKVIFRSDDGTISSMHSSALGLEWQARPGEGDDGSASDDGLRGARPFLLARTSLLVPGVS